MRSMLRAECLMLLTSSMLQKGHLPCQYCAGATCLHLPQAAIADEAPWHCKVQTAAASLRLTAKATGLKMHKSDVASSKLQINRSTD